MKWILFLIIFLGETNLVFAGGTVENGGDLIVCRDENAPEPPPIRIPPINPADPGDGKYFSLDYIYAIGAGSSPSDFASIRDWEDSQGRLVKILSGVSHGLLRSFSRFAESTQQMESLDNDNDLVRKREWSKLLGLTRYRTNKIDGIPENCLVKQANGNGTIVKIFSYFRAIIRIEKKSRRSIVYHYNPYFLKSKVMDSPLQLSFIMIHEWLWDYTQDSNVNRSVNNFLHSKEIEKMSSGEIRQRLIDLGLKF